MLRFHPHTALCAQSWVGQFLLGGVADLARGPRLACYGAEALLIPRLDYRKRPPLSSPALCLELPSPCAPFRSGGETLPSV